MGNFNKWKSLFAFLIIYLFALVTLVYFNLGERTQDTPSWVHISPEQCEALSANASEFQNISECGCTRKFFYKAPATPCKRLDSTCSDEGSHYEKGQKVVSLSLCIKDPENTKQILEYMEGVSENLKRMKEYYPGSTMRIYTDMNLEPGSAYCELLCSNPELHWCDIRNTPSLGDQSEMFLMTWRFLPLGDPTVDYFLSRDLDSVIIERQVGAVREWLQSDKAFHTMRDKYPEHNAPILGGLWGARNSMLGMRTAESLRKEIIRLAKRSPKKKGRDQAILNQVIFYPRRKEMVVFDSYFCKQWRKYTEVRPFPVKRKDTHYDFAGNIGLGKAKYDISKCPVECRPKYGKDWEYC